MKYTESHEWYEKGRVGISKYAQEELGEIVYIELPKVGQLVRAGEEVAVLESTKAAADIYSPLSGTILSVNERLKEEILLLSQDPEGEGYLLTLKPSDQSEEKMLISKEDYLALHL